MSSWTIALLSATIPTTVIAVRTAGGGGVFDGVEAAVLAYVPQDTLPEVQVELPRRRDRHHQLVGTPGISHPPCDHGHPVLGEVLAVDAAVDVHVGVVSGAGRLSVPLER